MPKNRYDQLRKDKGKLTKQITFEIEKNNNLEERRILRFKASTESEDRDLDIIRADGWKIDTYKTNPIILYMHQRALPAVARCVNIFIDKLNKQLVMDVKFPTLEELSSSIEHVHDHAKFSDMLYNMYVNGYMSTVSVGFMGIKFSRRTDQPDVPEYARGILFEEQELLELSLVTIPANPEAQMVRSAMAKGFITEADYKIATDYTKLLMNRKGSLKSDGIIAYDEATIVETEWSAADVRSELDPIELAKVSLVWNNQKEEEDLTKADSKFPHHETNGNINRNALVAAKGAILGARGGARPFADQSQEAFDKMIRTAVEDHLNLHLEAAGLDPIELEDIKTIKFSDYADMFKDYYSIDQINEAFNAESEEDAYKALITKFNDPFGNPSMRDIENAVDVHLRSREIEAFSLDFYPISYPSGRCTVLYYRSDILKLHNYTFEQGEQPTIELDEGVEIELTTQFKSYYEEKAGAEISRKNREKIEAAIEASKLVTETLEELVTITVIEEEDENKTINNTTPSSEKTFVIVK